MKVKSSQILAFCLLLQFHLSYAANCKWRYSDPEFFEDTSCDKTRYCSQYAPSTYFDIETKKCILPLGSLCHEIRYGRLACSPNTICKSHYKCVCDDMDFEKNGACEKGKGYLEECSGSASESDPSSPCAINAGLSCQQGKCHCSGTNFWSSETSFCIKKKCEDRIPDAFEDPDSHACKLILNGNRGGPDIKYVEKNLISCPKESTMRNDNYGSVQCTCDLNFIESQDRRVCLPMKTYGEKCSTQEEPKCNDFIGLSCQEGICRCGHPSAMYNPIDSLCYSQDDCDKRYRGSFFYSNATMMECRCLIDYSCGPKNQMGNGKDMLTCPDNSIHKLNNNRCDCVDGYIYSHDSKTCIPIKFYGEACTTDQGNPCSPKARLSCLENISTCGCKDNEVWNALSQKCGLREHEKCDDSREDPCSRHAKCKFYVRGLNYCQCDEGYTAVDGHCLGDHLSNCELDGDCRDGTFCTDGLCKCKNLRQQFYDSEQKKCVTMAGASCNADDVCNWNSECEDGICKCKNGFNKTPKGNCAQLFEHGETCIPGQCDFTKGLACTNGVCACVDESMGVVPGKGCTVAVGQECGLLEQVGKCSSEDKQCESYMVNCDSSAHCQHMGKGVAQCQLLTAPSTP